MNTPLTCVMPISRRVLSTSPWLIKSITRLTNPFPAPRISSFAAFTPIRTMADMTPVFSKDAAPAGGPYSHAIKTPTAIYCSGSIPMDSQGNLIQGTITEQTTQVFKNLKAILTEAGSSLEKVVKVNVFLADMGSFAEMNEEYAKWLPQKPARSCVAVKTLPKNVDVEIECIALP
ncbi:Endoribonuclease L-PSP-domain-containing protein [Xylaria sp. FL1777]|nr:Endoribonuclease L-PSP-domain-containing protein [Xylaria sp. FL1777]